MDLFIWHSVQFLTTTMEIRHDLIYLCTIITSRLITSPFFLKVGETTRLTQNRSRQRPLSVSCLRILEKKLLVVQVLFRVISGNKSSRDDFDFCNLQLLLWHSKNPHQFRKIIYKYLNDMNQILINHYKYNYFK